MDVLQGLKKIPDESVDLVMSSPPYWGLRDYGVEGQHGLEPHPQQWIDKEVKIFHELRRVLKPTGSVFWNVGDSYYTKSGVRGKFNDGKWLQTKQLMLMPSRLAVALQNDGWCLRSDIIWHKPTPMPSSVKDRLANTYEHVFHFVKKSKGYYYDLDAIREPHSSAIKRGQVDNKGNVDYRGLNKNAFTKEQRLKEHLRPEILSGGDGRTRAGLDSKTKLEKMNPSGKNPGDFWEMATQPYSKAHFAVYPIKLCEKPIKACVPDEICVKCEKARERIIRTTYTASCNKSADGQHNEPKAITKHLRQSGNYDTPQSMKYGRANAQHITMSWTSCGCNAGFRGGVVLDPFAGSGTTGEAVRKWKPNASIWLIELNSEYCDLIKKRVKWGQQGLKPITYEVVVW